MGENRCLLNTARLLSLSDFFFETIHWELIGTADHTAFTTPQSSVLSRFFSCSRMGKVRHTPRCDAMLDKRGQKED